jgi:hypothetical protein
MGFDIEGLFKNVVGCHVIVPLPSAFKFTLDPMQTLVSLEIEISLSITSRVTWFVEDPQLSDIVTVKVVV